MKGSLNLHRANLTDFDTQKKELTKMTTVYDIYSFIEDIAPYRLQEGYDNSGLNVGRNVRRGKERAGGTGLHR